MFLMMMMMMMTYSLYFVCASGYYCDGNASYQTLLMECALQVPTVTRGPLLSIVFSIVCLDVVILFVIQVTIIMVVHLNQTLHIEFAHQVPTVNMGLLLSIVFSIACLDVHILFVFQVIIVMAMHPNQTLLIGCAHQVPTVSKVLLHLHHVLLEHSPIHQVGLYKLHCVTEMGKNFLSDLIKSLNVYILSKTTVFLNTR